MELTQDERMKIVANMLFVNRLAAMSGQQPPFNSEAMLVMLIGPEWFVKISGGQNIDELMPTRIPIDRIWAKIQHDIERLYPNNFDWKNQKRKGASV